MFPRCATCNKKLPLSATIGQQCKCNKIFCTTHLYSHECTFDHLGSNKEKLEKNNVVIEPVKIVKL